MDKLFAEHEEHMVISVSEITQYLSDTLYEDPFFRNIWVRGEITNATRANSGHWYFSLKDDQSLIRCAMFRGSITHATPQPQNGKQMIAHGRLELYKQRGDVQMIVEEITDVGLGELYQKFLALQRELQELGYFAAERKQAIPVSPNVIGVVTSKDAAALRDMIRTWRLRWPLAKILLAHTLVQGAEAPAGIAAAIKALNEQPDVDVIVVARGGGSLEDLWAFNDRLVADAIYASQKPIVSGVGHEVDFTITDFVADLRAATPTAAAAAVSLERSAVLQELEDLRAEFIGLFGVAAVRRQNDLAALQRRIERESPRRRLATLAQQVDDAESALSQTMARNVALLKERAATLAARMDALSPLRVLARGYAVVSLAQTGAAVTSVNDAAADDTLSIRVADGAFAARKL